MSTNVDQIPSIKPHILLVANPEGLAINLAEQFLANFCRVKIYSDKRSAWDKLALHLRENSNLSLTDSQEDLKNDHFDYAIFISGSIAKIYENKVSDYLNAESTRSEAFLKNFQKQNSKSYAIFPFSNPSLIVNQNRKIIDEIKKIQPGVNIIYVGDLIGPRVLLSGRNPVSSIIKALLFYTPISNINRYIYPIDVRNLAKSISKEVFSFSHYDDIALLGSRYNFLNFVSEAKKIFPNIQINSHVENSISEVENDKKIYEALDLRGVLRDSMDWYSKGVYDFLLERKQFGKKSATLDVPVEASYKKPDLNSEVAHPPLFSSLPVMVGKQPEPQEEGRINADFNNTSVLPSAQNLSPERKLFTKEKPTFESEERLLIPTVKSVKVREFSVDIMVEKTESLYKSLLPK